jgi:hypothetical protein
LEGDLFCRSSTIPDHFLGVALVPHCGDDIIASVLSFLSPKVIAGKRDSVKEIVVKW